MSSPSSPREATKRLTAIPHIVADFLHSIPDDQPLQIALRTYALSLSLALGPALLPFVTSAKARRNALDRLKTMLKRELSVSGFASAMTVGVGGGAAIRTLWECVDDANHAGDVKDGPRPGNKGSSQSRMRRCLSSLKDSHKTFISYAISSSLAFSLLHSRREEARPVSSYRSTPLPLTLPISDLASRKGLQAGQKPSITLDVTLLLLVRAMDSFTQMVIRKYCELTESENSHEQKEKIDKQKRSLRMKSDALVFWACSARIMWCFFYKPERLPRSYNKWIMTLANIDGRVLGALRALRSGVWSYRRHHSTQPDIVSSLSRDLGYPEKWGNPSLLPAYGGKEADAAWKLLGVPGRNGVGGIPCELVHSGVGGGSCTANAAIRGAQAFGEAFLLYLPVHFLPIVLTHPRSLLKAPRLLRTLLSVLRSASFLSTFVSSIWFAVCLTRTLFLARLFPWISHDIWDGPFGCTFVGSLVCGGSIWIEQGRRRAEIALYVLPRAIRACLPERWVRSGSRGARYAERLAFVLSLSTILTAATHQPSSLRGLSRWTVAFVMKGPNAGFWKRKRQDPSAPSTPADITPSADIPPLVY